MCSHFILNSVLLVNVYRFQKRESFYLLWRFMSEQSTKRKCWNGEFYMNDVTMNYLRLRWNLCSYLTLRRSTRQYEVLVQFSINATALMTVTRIFLVSFMQLQCNPTMAALKVALLLLTAMLPSKKCRIHNLRRNVRLNTFLLEKEIPVSTELE